MSDISSETLDASSAGEITLPAEMPILPISEAVIFPSMMVPLVLSDANLVRLADDCLAGDKILGAFTQQDLPDDDTEDEDIRDQDLIYRVGTAVRIQKMLRFPDGSMRLLGQGVARCRITEFVTSEPYMKARVELIGEDVQDDSRTLAYMRGVANNFMKIIDANESLSEELKVVVMNIDDPGRLADLVATNLDIEVAEKQQILEEPAPRKRLQMLSKIVLRELDVLELGQKLQTRVRKSIDKDQREYYLRQQLKAIQRELGEADEGSVELDELQARIAEADLPKNVQAAAEREFDRLSRMSPGASEYTVSKTFLDWILDLPWSVSSDDKLNLKRAEEVLNRDHYGLEDVKERIIEYLAVRKLKRDHRGPILCLVGPPGVGKTSLGRSIADAVGRKFFRFSLGGMRDEAEIRGHRRTYVGAMPGRIIAGMKDCGTNNPVFMLDEIDKLGQDFRGDPASALLEVLDPEQNSSFTDHYLTLPFDLSSVMFITTANMLDTIPRPLLDRMEIIQLAGYTNLEKLQIAKRYLVPRQVDANGLSGTYIRFTDAGLMSIIENHTREAGVRNLEREIGSVCRKVATDVAKGRRKKQSVTARSLEEYLGPPSYREDTLRTRLVVGVVTGLAWTQVGGKILYIEGVSLPGGRGALNLTGQVGSVMQESASAAYSYLRHRFGAKPEYQDFFSKRDVHIHLPAGAIPKDGPSAGIAMASVLLSLLLKKPIDRRTAMTGEITLTGAVLPIGGLLEKVLAAHRAGIRRIIIPESNTVDLEDVPEEVRSAIEFVPVKNVNRVWETVFPGVLD
ncbi:endopeptidase La [bacterium CG17_big_fil_post_rev_8_21_14_2_50_64_8]|nr:MAG: endopeptidase La [bacterium CG17_big_fil_post_rev_8_21_14_2_50_64_8]PJA76973.1 MAG: endopeptidase La [bacterium CG_4_9_14_3_um_filter_65_15]